MPISVKFLKKLDLEYIFDNFMWCNIELAAKQFPILEKMQLKEKVLSKPKLRVYNEYKEQRGEKICPYRYE